VATTSFSDRHARDVVWISRRLADLLSAGATLPRALEAVAQRAPARSRPLLDGLTRRVSCGGRMSAEMADRGAPSYVWGAVRQGEVCGDMAPALTALADRLDLEQALPPARDDRLRAYALAFGRLGMLLAIGVPFLQALESAAESVVPSDVSDALLAARMAMAKGDGFADALDRAAPDLPATAIEMMRDGERDGRLDQALPIIADYLLDEAAQKPARRSKKEGSNA